MPITVSQLDEMSQEEAAPLLADCCASGRWVRMMLARRPFRSGDAVFFAADTFWNSLTSRDRLEAFSHHPRIGEKNGEMAQGEKGTAWSAAEQSGLDRVDLTRKRELADINREYEERFGYIYIVCAAGKTAEELIGVARARLGNNPARELVVASEEQRKIMRLRLEKLLNIRAEEI